MATNPIRKPQSAALERALKAAPWLHNVTEYAAGVQLAKLMAEQLDDLVNAQDPELVKLMHMRSIPRYREVLETLGLTPTAHSRMTSGAAAGAPPAENEDEDDEPESKPATNPLDALAAEVENVVQLHRPK